MARPQKKGLDFYSVDTGLFLNRKIKRVIRSFGGNGYMIYSHILTEIYRDKGCFIEWDSNTAFDVSDTLNVKETLVNEVVSYCANVGLFDKELLRCENVLTSKNIQEFWLKVSRKAKRKDLSIDSRFDLTREETTATEELIPSEREETNSKQEESTQRKGKERKVKESKGNNKKPFRFAQGLSSLGFDKDLISQWLDVRKKKGGVNTQVAFEEIQKQVGLCKEKNICINEVLKTHILKNWIGFKLKWALNNWEKEGDSNSKKESPNDRGVIKNNGKNTVIPLLYEE